MKDIDNILKLKQELIRFYREKHRRQRLAWNFYNGDFHVLAGKIRERHHFHEVLTMDARLMVESITGHIRPTSFTVSFEPLKSTVAEQERADKLEQLVYALLQRWGTLKSLSPFSEGIKNIAIYGETAFRTLFNPNAWGEKPVVKEGEPAEDFSYREALWEANRQVRLPVVVNAVDPLNMLPCPGSQGHPDFMIESYAIKPYLLKKDFPDWKNTQAEDDYTNVDLTTYFDQDTWMYIVSRALGQGVNLRNPMNPYGTVPYILAWSGMGKTSPDGAPEDLAVGLIYPVIPQIMERSRSLTAASIILQATAIPRGYTRHAPAGGLNLDLAPGGVTEIGDTEVGWFDMQRVPSDLYQLADISAQQIERYVGEKILSGQRPAGVTSALFEEILLEQASRKYRALIESMEAAYAGVIAQALFLLERFVKEPIPGIAGGKFKAEDIKGYYQPSITFKYEDIAIERIRAMIGRMLFMSGLLDFETTHSKYLGTSDISKVRKGIIKDKIYQDPNLIAATAIELLEEMGVKETLEKAQRRQAQARAIKTSPITEVPVGEEKGLTPEEEARLASMLEIGAGERAERTMEPNLGGGFGFGEGFGGEERS